MSRSMELLRSFFVILITIVVQSIQFLRLALSSQAALSAEILFLRKQLVFRISLRIGRLTKQYSRKQKQDGSESPHTPSIWHKILPARG